MKNKKTNLTRKHIAQELQNDVGSITEAYHFTSVFFDSLIEEIVKNKILKIRNFGVFRCVQKKSRIGRNPKTGEKAEITPRRVVSFIASNKVKSKIASENREENIDQ